MNDIIETGIIFRSIDRHSAGALIDDRQGNSRLGVGYLGTICPFCWDLDA